MSFDARHVADTFVFVAGKIIAKNRYVFAAHDEELLAKEKYRTHLLLYEDGIWSELASFNWQSVGLTIAVKEPLQILVLGRDGQVGIFEGKPSQSKLETKRPIGPMRGITTIGSTAYAYGMKRDVFRRVTSTTWQPFDSGMKAALPTKGKIDVSAIIRDGIKNMGGINSISQVPGGAVPAFGMRGEIWKLLKTTWKRVDSPTNVMLQDSTPRNDGTVWVCGQL